MKLNLHISSVIMLALVLFFQNCSKVSFYSSKGILTPKVDSSEEISAIETPTVENPPAIEEPPVVENPPVIEEPPVVENPPTEVPPIVENPPVEETPGKSPPKLPPSPVVESAGEGKFICILAGPGKSVRLGISSEFLIENGHTPDTICMSQQACLEIVSQKYQVKAAEERGYCPGKNKHVISLTDEEIQAKIDEL